MNYGALLQDSLEDPTLMIQKKRFGIAFLKEMIFTIRVSFMCKWAVINEHECKHTQL